MQKTIKACQHKTKTVHVETFPTKTHRGSEQLEYDVTYCSKCGKKLRSELKEQEANEEGEEVSE